MFNDARLGCPFSNVQRKEIARISEELVASVTNGLRDTAVEQIDTRRLILAESRERAVTNASHPS